MASQTLIASKFEIPTTPTEIVSKISEDEIHEKYLVKLNVEQEDYSSLPYMEPSLVDFQLLLDSEDELQTFGSYLNSWGCFQLVNHGISSSKLDEVLQLCNEFFDLPLEEKQKYARVKGQVQGYGGDTMYEDQNFNWNDRLLLAVYPLERRYPQFWPEESIPKFRERVEEYCTELRRVFEVVSRAISKYLKLEDDNLINKYAKDPFVIFRLNKYPPCPCPEKVTGLKPHSDVNTLTFLLPDKEVEGFHIEKDGQWYRVPTVPDALVINAADMLEILSNGRIKSVYHRAVVDKTRERISIACGFGPPRFTEIGPLKELITDETPQLYKSHENYVELASNTFAIGERAINTMKISKPSEI